MNETLSVDCIVVAAKDQVSCDLAGEAVILDMAKGVYYGLDPVGASVWSLIQEPRTVSEIRDSLLDEYEVGADRCEGDLLQLLQTLRDQGLVEVQGEAAA